MSTDMIAIPATVLVLAHSALIAALLVQRLKRRRAEDAVRRLLATQESERCRLAHELHDNLSQKLALLCLDIASLNAHASREPAIGESVVRLSERTKDIALDVHCLTHDLHPPALELLGLSPAIERLCRDVSRQCGIRIDFNSPAVSRRISRNAALCLFRITQEALQNIVKHSGARHATVSLAEAGRKIRLHIADSGKGFDRTWTDRTGLGLLSMRERALFAGGRMGIRTAVDRGTRIMATLLMNWESIRTRFLKSA
jgi:signal transduction histidine kinase